MNTTIIIFFSMFLAVLFNVQFDNGLRHKKTAVISHKIRNIKNLEIDKLQLKVMNEDTTNIHEEIEMLKENLEV